MANIGNELNQKNWFKRHPILTILLAILGIAFIASAYSDSGNSMPSYHPLNTPQIQHDLRATVVPSPSPYYPYNGLSNDTYYKNSAGNEVHSPARSSTVPVGASAQCRDGTYSFSQHRSGTCSHHGGVSQWY